MPEKWNDLYKLLPDRKRKGGGWEPPLPLILAAWHDSPILSKKMRLRTHLEWADAKGALADVFQFLDGLSNEDWYYGD